MEPISNQREILILGAGSFAPSLSYRLQELAKSRNFELHLLRGEIPIDPSIFRDGSVIEDLENWINKAGQQTFLAPVELFVLIAPDLPGSAITRLATLLKEADSLAFVTIIEVDPKPKSASNFVNYNKISVYSWDDLPSAFDLAIVKTDLRWRAEAANGADPRPRYVRLRDASPLETEGNQEFWPEPEAQSDDSIGQLPPDNANRTTLEIHPSHQLGAESETLVSSEPGDATNSEGGRTLGGTGEHQDPAVVPAGLNTRSTNGPLIVDYPSTPNSRHWYESGWAELPIGAGGTRDFECEYGTAGELAIVAGTVRGWKHRFRKSENQDAFAIGRSNDTLVGVVADGVSSARYSSFAARSLSKRVAQFLSEREKNGEQSFLEFQAAATKAVEQASEELLAWNRGDFAAPRIDQESMTTDEKVRELATTLSVVEVPLRTAADGIRHAFLCSVGDSPCFTLDRGRWSLQSKVIKGGPIMDHSTRALPIRPLETVSLEFTQFELTYDSILVLMTDGIGTSLATGETPVGRWLAPKIESLLGSNIETAFHDLIAFDRKGEDDDRTLLVIFNSRQEVS